MNKYQDFFDFMYNEHTLILTVEEMREIILKAQAVETEKETSL